MVNTKTAPRRELSFASLDELSAELDRLEAANAAGNTHAQDWASRIEAAFGRAPSCAEQVWPAIDAKCLVTVDGRALNQPVRNAI